MQIECSWRGVAMAGDASATKCEGRINLHGTPRAVMLTVTALGLKPDRDRPTTQVHVYCIERCVRALAQCAGSRCMVSRSEGYVTDHNLRISLCALPDWRLHASRSCPPLPSRTRSRRGRCTVCSSIDASLRMLPPAEASCALYVFPAHVLPPHRICHRICHAQQHYARWSTRPSDLRPQYSVTALAGSG